MALTARKTTTRTHARGKLLGVHIGVYQAQSITPFQKFEP